MLWRAPRATRAHHRRTRHAERVYARARCAFARGLPIGPDDCPVAAGDLSRRAPRVPSTPHALPRGHAHRADPARDAGRCGSSDAGGRTRLPGRGRRQGLNERHSPAGKRRWTHVTRGRGGDREDLEMPRGRAGTRGPGGTAPEARTARTRRRCARATGLALRLALDPPVPSTTPLEPSHRQPGTKERRHSTLFQVVFFSQLLEGDSRKVASACKMSSCPQKGSKKPCNLCLGYTREGSSREGSCRTERCAAA